MQDRTVPLALPSPARKKVVVAFDVAGLTGDGGIGFVRSVDGRLGLTASLAELPAAPPTLAT